MMKIQNRSVKQKVDEGEEKKNEKERGRKKRSWREREKGKERKRKYFFNGRGERNLIK